MRPTFARVMLLLAACCFWMLSGCSDPYARAQHAHRLSRIEWVLDSYKQREQRSAENLRRTIGLLEEANVLTGDPDHAYRTAVWMFH